MSEILLMKAPGGLLFPCDAPSLEIVNSWPVGQGIRATVRRARNVKFHRKFFAMLNLGFDAWEPPALEYRGLPVVKNFERFRKDCMVAAGYYEAVVNLKGEVRAEAKSIAFSNMDEGEFEAVYGKVADVLLQRVLTKYTRADLDRVVNELMGFL